MIPTKIVIKNFREKLRKFSFIFSYKIQNPDSLRVMDYMFEFQGAKNHRVFIVY